MSIREWLEAHKDELVADRSATVKKCMKEMGVAERSVTDMIPKIMGAATPAAVVAGSGTQKEQRKRTLSDFVRENDESWKIRDGLKRMFADGTYMTDAEFREAVAGNSARWRGAADSTEFDDYKLRHKGELLWAAPDTITQMKRIIGRAV